MKLSKKIIKPAFAFMAMAVFFSSCQSTKTSESEKKAEIVDSYENADENAESDKIEITGQIAEEKSSVQEDFSSFEESDESAAGTKNKENPFIAFFTNNGKSRFKEAGTFDLSTATMGTKIKGQEATFLFDTKNYDAGFGSLIMTAYYNVLMDKKTRSVYINAVNSYFSDFENKKLNRKDKKSVKKYGKSKAEISWGLMKGSTTNYGTADICFGYTFKNKSPYFTITVYPTINQKRYTDDVAPEQSMMLNYYLTKAQSRELAEFLTEENLMSLFDESLPRVINVENDDY